MIFPQTAVYWAPNGHTGDGNATFSDGVEVAVRWQFEGELFVNRQGQNQTSQAIVYYDGSFDAVTNGRWYFGLLEDLTVEQVSNPRIVDGAYQVMQVGESPSVDASQSLGKSWL